MTDTITKEGHENQMNEVNASVVLLCKSQSASQNHVKPSFHIQKQHNHIVIYTGGGGLNEYLKVNYRISNNEWKRMFNLWSFD